MTLEVRWFASLADRTGTRRESVEVGNGADVAALWEILAARHPGLREVRARPVAACDRERSPWTRTLDGVSEVAFLPPVSGG